jgi:CHAD domain-containing protein
LSVFVVADYLLEQRETLVAAVPAARAGDADAVHDMRVAVRRLRATLRTFRPLLDARVDGRSASSRAEADGRTESVRAELRWLGGLLGPVRDVDVLSARLAVLVAEEPPELVLGPVAARLDQRFAAAAAKARVDLDQGLDSDRYADLINSLGVVIAEAARPMKPRRLRACARRAVRRADRLLAAAVHALEVRDEGAATRLHEARRAFKRARYAVEVLASSGPARAGQLVARLKALQDLLGEAQDAVTAERELRDAGVRAYLGGENAFTYGLLHARQRPAGRWAVPGLSRARRRATRRRLRAWL